MKISQSRNLQYLKIRRRDGVESWTTLEEGKFKVPIDSCIRWSGSLCFSFGAIGDEPLGSGNQPPYVDEG